MDKSGKIQNLTNKQMKFNYRKSVITKEVILKAEFKVKIGSEDKIKKR